ncbi:type II toxin-antitoxin system ParD family antitoxin [Sodalis sp. RH23]
MTTSIALSPHFEEFIRAQIDSGRYNVSVNSVTY